MAHGGAGARAGNASVAGGNPSAGAGAAQGQAGAAGSSIKPAEAEPTADGGTTRGDAGSCDEGHQTIWATDCPTAPKTTCTAGSWTDPGSTTNDPLVCESAHFAVHAPNGTISAAQCTAATDTLESVVWPTLFGAPIFFPEPYCDSAQKYNVS